MEWKNLHVGRLDAKLYIASMLLLLLASLAIGVCDAAIVRVGSAKLTTAGSTKDGFPTAQGVITYSATSGNLLLVACVVNNKSVINMRMIDGVNTWVKDQYITDTTNAETFYLYHAINVTGGALSISCQPIAPGGGRLTIDGGYTLFVAEYSGFTTNYIGDGSNLITKLGSGTAPSAGLLQTANADALLVSVFATSDISATCGGTAGTGWTLVQGNSDASSFPCGGLMERIVSTTGNWTGSASVTSANWVIGIAPYVPVASSGPPVSVTTKLEIAASGGYWSTSINNSNGASSNVATFNGSQYVCYATTALALRIAKINLTTSAFTIYNPGLPIWSTSDEHNSCSMQMDSDGYIHITYDMHVGNLNYYKSAAPEDPTSFTGPLPMLGGTPETSVTFGVFSKSPATGQLTYTFHYGSFTAGIQYFYVYNVGTAAWESPSGLTAGLLTNYTAPGNPFVNGLPQWAPDGKLWFSWVLYPPGGGMYLVGWNGSSFVKFSGAAQAMPMTGANSTAILAGTACGTDPIQQSILSNFAIDAAGAMFLSCNGWDASGYLQEYVVESTSGAFMAHQLTQNSIVYNVPNASLDVAGTSQSPSIFTLGSCAYFVYNDQFHQRPGTMAVQSCDGFATTARYLLGSDYSPNWILFTDQIRQATGAISFLFENTNDADFRFSYLNNDSPNLGKIWIVTWSPGGSSASGRVTISGNGVVR